MLQRPSRSSPTDAHQTRWQVSWSHLCALYLSPAWQPRFPGKPHPGCPTLGGHFLPRLRSLGPYRFTPLPCTTGRPGDKEGFSHCSPQSQQPLCRKGTGTRGWAAGTSRGHLAGTEHPEGLAVLMGQCPSPRGKV